MPFTFRSLLTLAVSLCGVNAARAAATTPSQVIGFGSTAVNGVGVVTNVAFTLSGLTAAPAVSLAGVDFSAAALTCNAGFTSCSSNVTFLPLSAGLREDALVLKNSSGVVLAAAYLYGTGTGPLARLMPARIKTSAGNGAWAYVDSTTSTSASFRNPQGLAADALSNIYVADSVNQVVRKIAASNGAVSTVVGNGTAARTGDGGAALSASLNTPTGIAVDSAGNLFIADQGNSVVRRVDAISGIITTAAGGGTTATGTDGYGDGLPAGGAILSGCGNVAVDYAGNLFISDSFHNLVRKVTAATGIISVVAGGGSAAGTDGYGDGLAATSASLANPTGITVDASGNVYISDSGHSMVRLVSASSGIITAFAGTGSYAYQGDGSAANAASLGSPAGLRLDAAGNLYVADFAFNVVRVVNASTGIISTLAGNGTAGYSGDNGMATMASLNNPSDLVFDGSGNLLICDYSNNVVRQVSFSPPTLTFPGTNIAVTSPLSTLTLANFGNAALNVASITVSAAFAQKPSGGTDCAASTVLASGASCQIAIAFIPTVAGAITGTLTLGDNSLNHSSATQAVSLAGTGVSGTPAANLNPTSLTFASQTVGTSSAPQTVTLSNSGTAALNISNLSLGGSNASDFLFTTTCQSVLATSASCTITVTFKPMLSGTRTASISVLDTALSSPQTLTLTGTGVGGATPSLNVAQLQFGSQVLSTAAAGQTVTLSNSGTSTLSIYGVALSGVNAADFWLMATTCGTTLAASASCTITVQFLPLAIGTRSAALLVSNSSGNASLSAALTGIGIMPALSVSPATPTFMSEYVGVSASPVSIVVANPVNYPVSIASIVLSGTNVGDFTLSSNSCSATLTANSCTLGITFTPQATGARTATLTITNTGSTPALTVPLSAAGIIPAAPGLLYYLASDFTIHEVWNGGTRWYDANLMSSSQSGNSISPGTKVTTNGNGTIYYVASDQTIHQMWWGGTKMLDANLMASSESGNTVQPGTSLTVDSSGEIYYVAQDQTIHAMWWGGTKMLDANLMASSQSGSIVEAATGMLLDQNENIFYVASDQTIHQMWWGGTKMLDVNLMASSQSGNTVESGVGIVNDNSGNMFYISTDRRIHQMWWGGTKYMDANLMASSQSGLQVSPGTECVTDNNGNIYYVASNQTVHKMWWGGTQFLDLDMTASSQSGVLVEPGTAITLDSTTNIYYVATDQTLHAMWWGGTQVIDLNLMASAQSVGLVSGTYTIQGQVTSNSAGLAGVTVKLGGTRSYSAVTDSNGNYSFSVPAGGLYTVTPSIAGHSFSPASVKFTAISAAQTANFIGS